MQPEPVIPPSPDDAPPRSDLVLKLVLAGALVMNAYQLSDNFQQLARGGGELLAPRWYLTAVVLISAAAMGALWGIWKLKRLAVLAYLGVTAAQVAVVAKFAPAGVVAVLVAPSVVTLMALISLPRMR